jgi:hypothetical protein
VLVLILLPDGAMGALQAVRRRAGARRAGGRPAGAARA